MSFQTDKHSSYYQCMFKNIRYVKMFSDVFELPRDISNIVYKYLGAEYEIVNIPNIFLDIVEYKETVSFIDNYPKDIFNIVNEYLGRDYIDYKFHDTYYKNDIYFKYFEYFISNTLYKKQCPIKIMTMFDFDYRFSYAKKYLKILNKRAFTGKLGSVFQCNSNIYNDLSIIEKFLQNRKYKESIKSCKMCRRIKKYLNHFGINIKIMMKREPNKIGKKVKRFYITFVDV